MAAAAKSHVQPAAWFGLAILIVFYLLSFIDKQILALLANLLGRRLGVSDVQIGLLQGFIFSIPYAVANLIVGWAADRYARRMLLLFGVAFWSLAGAGSAFATSFESLALFRAGVGFGEGALIPIALSILASLFPRDRLAFAVGVFYTGASLGGVLGLAGGGAAIQAFVDAGNITLPVVGMVEPWQAAFLSVGLPGVLLAFLAFAIGVNDRDRAKTVKAGGAAAGAWTFAGYVREHRFFLATYVLSTSLTTICAYTIISWAAAYFGRAFAWDHARIGLVVGLGMGCGGIGNVMWGYLADWLTRRGYPDGIYRVFIPLMILGPPVAAVAFLVRDPVICLPAFALMSVVFSGFGPIMAALQVAAPDYLRGRLTAAKMVLASIVGLGAGPVAAGFLVDVVFQDRNRLGEAMTLTITVASLAAAALLVWGRKAYVRAVEQVAQTSSAVAPADAPLPAGAPATGTA